MSALVPYWTGGAKPIYDKVITEYHGNIARS